MSSRFVVILAGGRGERFWPQSRLRRPKHFLPIVGDRPLLRQTVDRLAGLIPPDHLFILTNREQAPAVAEICPELGPGQVVAEPVGRDTAPAVGLAALLVQRRDPAGAFAMLPADHAIHDAEGFRRTLETAFAVVEGVDPRALCTIGIAPSYPATGFGYIEVGEEGPVPGGSQPVRAVRRFVEKPDAARAEAFLASGQFRWNAGMFVWRADAILGEIAAHAPALGAGLQRLAAAWDAGESLAPVLDREYPTLPRISIDYAVMEKARGVRVVEAGFDWDDVGEWPALARHLPADDRGNILRGEAVVEEGSGNIVVTTPGKLVALLGVHDLVVVETADALLVCPRSRAQEIKKVVTRLAADEALRRFV